MRKELEMKRGIESPPGAGIPWRTGEIALVARKGAAAAV
jgi:hypothetical protein